MRKKLFNKLILLSIFFFLFPVIVKAGYANIGMTGGTVTVGEQVTVYISISSTDSMVTGIGGYLSYDTNYLTLNSCASTSKLSYQSGARTAFIDWENAGISGGTVGYCVFTTNAVGSTTVTINSIEATSNADGKVIPLSASVSGASITIKNPPSSNNNLSSLKVSPGSINFNKNTTSYNISVDSNITSVNITASAEDSTARIEGTGSRGLNYGNNALDVNVIAENGAVKTYTINVNRKDDRSTNNNLSSLSVSSGKLSPGFNKNTTHYSMEVPYEVSRLNISANAEDSRAHVDINNPELVAEATTTVSVTVTAENGSTKTYSIDVKRGKDPNKILSKDNYLNNLSVSVGILSPEFDREKLNYAVYLPYEVSYIVVDIEVSDTTYATVDKIENNNLSIGNNLFRYTVTAEDGSTRIYTLTVVRNKSLEEVSSNTNTYLKSLSLKNGKLANSFNKTSEILYYKKTNKNVEIKEAIPEVEENTVSTYKLNKAFIIIVETPAGEKGFYILLEKSNLTVYIISIILLLVAILITFFIVKKKKTLTPEEREIKKLKKSKKSKE